jgi:GAF domain-containing protein
VSRPRRQSAATGGPAVVDGQVVDEQAALRRVATLVARGAPSTEVFTAVTHEAAGLLGADLAGMSRFDPDDLQTVVAAWPGDRDHVAVGTRLPIFDGDNIARAVHETGQPARVDDWTRASGPVAESVRALGVRSSVGGPIVVDGRLWGVLIVDSRGEEPFPEGTEWQLAHFTELAATAVANGEARRELDRLAEEQSALRRVATLVAQGVSPAEAFAAVASELGRLLGAQIVHLNRLEPDGTITTVAAWSERGDHVPVGTRLSLDGDSVTARVVFSRRAARIDDYEGAHGEVAEALHARWIRSAVGSPILVEGRVWGAMVVASTRDEPQPDDTETHLTDFTELVGTAIANAHARAEVTRLAEEQAALRRVATLVARESSPAELFAAVAEEVGAVLGADAAQVLRYEPDGAATVVAGWSNEGRDMLLDTRLALEGESVALTVLQTGQPARIDSYSDPRGSIAMLLRALGLRSSVGAPIVVEGRLWGVVIAGSARDEPLGAGTEARIAEFTELVATAIANADGRAKLTASRARVVAAADGERRRIERNLPDGAQQRLVALGLQLRAAEATAPVELLELRKQLGDAVTGLTGVLEDLQEISRGLHPAILSQGGLEPALRVLARRSAVPVELRIDVPARLAERVEVAAYYVASESLANAAKHARATTVWIAAAIRDGNLALEVRDNGAGGADPARGSGLIGLTDRVEALGGRLEIISPFGEGTLLRAALPVDELAASR